MPNYLRHHPRKRACTWRKFRSACAFALTDQNLYWVHFVIVKDAKFLYAGNEDSNQTARMRRLIWVFVWRIWQKVRFFTLQFICMLRAYKTLDNAILLTVNDLCGSSGCSCISTLTRYRKKPTNMCSVRTHTIKRNTCRCLTHLYLAWHKRQTA